MAKILIVDDEPKIRSLINKYLTAEGYEADEAPDGEEAVYLTQSGRYDLIIMDIMMPETDGFTAANQIRKFSDTPIIMLSARGETYDKIHGLELGADDYIVKPFSPKELVLRVNAILRRGVNAKTDVYKNGDLEIDFTAHRVKTGDETLTLSPKEYELLAYLVKNAGAAMNREQILNAVWGYDFDGGDRTLDTHIKLLRKRLKNMGSHIVTVRGVGYRFE